jgi:hypothetical protein
VYDGHLDQVGDRVGRGQGDELLAPVAAADHPQRSQLTQHLASRTGSVHWKQLNGITLGPKETDLITSMVGISESTP